MNNLFLLPTAVVHNSKQYLNALHLRIYEILDSREYV